MFEFDCFDSETYPILPGLAAPPPVCVSWCDQSTPNVRATRLVLARPAGIELIRGSLRAGRRLVGANTAFDLAVACAAAPDLIPLVFEAYKAGLIEDVLLTEELIAIAEGTFRYTFDHETGEWEKTEFNLAGLAEKYCGYRPPKGKDTWRLRYGELDGIPVEEWPEDAREYAMSDAWLTRGVFLEQRETARRLIPDEVRIQQNRAAWALHLMGVWGIRTDPERVNELKARLTKEVEEKRGALVDVGFYRPKHKKKRPSPLVRTMSVIRGAISKAFGDRGELTPMSDPSEKYPQGQVKTDEETLKATKDPLLAQLAEVLNLDRLLTRFVPILEQGTHVPICARMNPIVSSGRCSVSKPPLQQLPRKGGVRECFIPRPGRKFLTADLDTAELRALAFVCETLFGWSKMGEALRRGEDLHLRLAAEIAGIAYEEAKRRMETGDEMIADERQFAKIPNFGLPGGMVAETLCDYAKQNNVTISIERARELYAGWNRAWPEMRLYFAHVKALVGYGTAQIKSFGLPMLRGDVGYTDGCNHFFQNLIAQCFKEWAWRCAWECYVGAHYPGSNPADPLGQRRSALYGCRPVGPMHDELVIEADEDPDRLSAAGDRLAALAVESCHRFIPPPPKGPPMTASAAAMARWYKGAKPKRDDSGRLICWEPKKSA